MEQNKNGFSIEEEDIIYSDSNENNNSKNNIFTSNEEPNEIIEKILIYIYNQNIKPEKTQQKALDIDLYKNQINLLCSKYESCYIVLLLLKSIRKLINKYREIIFELPIISEIFKATPNIKYPERCNSQNNKITKNSKYKNYFKTENNNTHLRSYPKYKSHKAIMKTIFAELYNIKKCLKKSAPLISQIFELPLSDFDKFSIEQCQKEEYLNILIRDKFISNEINKSRDPKLIILLNEISEGYYFNTKLMTEKLNYFHQILTLKRNYEQNLAIAQIGSSIDEKYPEDCEPIGQIKYNNFNNFINADDINSNNFLSAEADLDNLDFDIMEEDNIKD